MEKVEQDKEDGGMGGGVWVTVRVVRDLSLRRHLSRDLKLGVSMGIPEVFQAEDTDSIKALWLKHVRYATYWWSS